jgi:hypothetical protein
MGWLFAKDAKVGDKVTDERGRRLTKVRQIEGGGLFRSRAMFRDDQGREVHLDNATQVKQGR